MILSVRVSDGGVNRFGLRVIASLVNVPPIGTKERGAVPSLVLAGGCWVLACEKRRHRRLSLVVSLGTLVEVPFGGSVFRWGALLLLVGIC